MNNLVLLKELHNKVLKALVKSLFLDECVREVVTRYGGDVILHEFGNEFLVEHQIDLENAVPVLL